MFNNRKYLLLDCSEIEKIDFNQVQETSAETLRTSFDNQKTFIKWEGEDPDFIPNLATKQGPYSHEEISAILSTDDWKKPLPDK